MGLAASQARFLGLTARKSNVEYEGQQVNQQRTALANESASLYSQLTNLQVPTPPDVTQYYRTEYSFKNGDTTYTLTSLPVKGSDGKYTMFVSYPTDEISFKQVSDTGIDFSNVNDGKLKDYSELQNWINKQGNANNYTDNTAVRGIVSQNNYYYKVNPTSNDSATYKMQSTQKTNYATFGGVSIKYNQSGDYDSIKIDEFGDDYLPVSTTNVQDSEAYDLAMNDYQKAYNDYERKMATINAKTETIQQQDKSLELRLNQLDTEQNAISTEMDAVNKVIEKNVQSTFKTFA